MAQLSGCSAHACTTMTMLVVRSTLPTHSVYDWTVLCTKQCVKELQKLWLALLLNKNNQLLLKVQVYS